MPDYKKKKVSRFGFDMKKPNKPKKKKGDEDIVMKSQGKKAEPKAEPSRFRVVKGKREERRRRMTVTVAVIAVILVGCLLAHLILPVGLPENIVNSVHKIGSGSFPVELSGGETVTAEGRSGVFYTLTDTSVTAVTNSGKQVYNILHGYSNPVLKTSETRALVFDQGAGKLAVYNLNRKVCSFEDEDESIITAAISRDGVYAIATRAENYASTVTVYSKRGEKLYSWSSAKDTVNSVVISPSGKKIAVSTVFSGGGSGSSRVMIFSFDSADSIASFELSSDFVYSLEAMGKGFCILTKQNCSFVDWSKHRKVDIKSELELDMFRRHSGGAVLVFNRSSDKSDNTVMLISKNGEKLSEFNFKGIISDIEYDGGHIYCISDTAVLRYSKTGELLQTGSCEYGCKRLAVLSKNKVAVITDSSITRVELTEEEQS